LTPFARSVRITETSISPRSIMNAQQKAEAKKLLKAVKVAYMQRDALRAEHAKALADAKGQIDTAVAAAVAALGNFEAIYEGAKVKVGLAEKTGEDGTVSRKYTSKGFSTRTAGRKPKPVIEL
jgi:hypothetical protein